MVIKTWHISYHDNSMKINSEGTFTKKCDIYIVKWYLVYDTKFCAAHPTKCYLFSIFGTSSFRDISYAVNARTYVDICFYLDSKTYKRPVLYEKNMFSGVICFSLSAAQAILL